MVYQGTYCVRYIDCFLTLHCFTVPLMLPLINIGPQLYIHDVSITQSFCAFNCAAFSSCVFVCYMWDWVCDEFTGCAELRIDTCGYPYHGRCVVCLTEIYYALVLYKQKTQLQTFPIATMTVLYTMGIAADEYSEQ